MSLAYEVYVTAGINWAKGDDDPFDFGGGAEGSHEFSVEGKLGLDLQAKVALLCFDVGSFDLEAGGKAKGTLTKRSEDLWCSDVNAWVFAEASYTVEDAIAKLGGIDAKATREFWNAKSSPFSTPKWHFENFERVDKCTWNAGGDPDDPEDPEGPIVHTIQVEPKSSLDDYSWEELKTISDAIAVADNDAAGLQIARTFNLVDSDGKLQGDTKAITVPYDSTLDSSTFERHVRILGFRHDTLSSGGLAGISFEFADNYQSNSMNSSETNIGGWEASEMRAWLNTEFLDLLPSDLRACVQAVRKRTNNVGGETGGDTSVVSETSDMIWLLSGTEVYGSFSNDTFNSAVYDAEGTQYQLYADQGVTTKNHDFCVKDSFSNSSGYWLRSPVVGRSNCFIEVGLVTGSWLIGAATNGEDVSPGFCL